MNQAAIGYGCVVLSVAVHASAMLGASRDQGLIEEVAHQAATDSGAAAAHGARARAAASNAAARTNARTGSARSQAQVGAALCAGP